MSSSNVRFLRKQDVKQITHKSDSTLERWERRGLFPKRVHLGPQSIGWVESEVEEWAAAKATSRGLPKGGG